MHGAGLLALRRVTATEFLNLAGAELALDVSGRRQLESANDLARLMGGLWWCFGCASGEQEDCTEEAGITGHS